ncbi:hypothetical protein F4782DRAFT_234172 [Xylaria castorea]|nr:hypothetical protein F4782DRAFT_234172 [Xylaria castorea]
MAPAGGPAASAGGGGGGRGRGQNPPLPSIMLDCRQVAASNSTLNAFLGGRRQPSWLTNATPVQPTPRPARLPPAPTRDPIPAPSPTERASSVTQPQPQPQSQPQSQPQPQPRSRPQSHLPHQSYQSHQSHHPSQPSLLPPSQSPGRSPHQPLYPLPASSPSAPLQPPQTFTALGPPRLSTLADPIRPPPTPSDEPSPFLSLPRDSPNDRNLCSVSSHQDPPTTQAHFVLDNHVNSSLLSSPQSREPVSPVDNSRNTSPQGTTQTQLPATASSSVEMALNTTPTSTTIGSINAATAARDAPRSIAPKRRRTEDNSLAILDSLGAQARLDSFLREVGGESGLEETIERPRFLLLRKACSEGDFFFVALHQLFCSWTANQASVHGLCHEGVHDTSLVDNAFGIMGSVLKANSKLGVKLLRWFAYFPVSLSNSQLCQPYAEAINQVLDFLICVSKKWSLVNHDHSLLGYPLLMNELINTFRLYSPILQSIVFRASRRTLGVPDHPTGIRLDELFLADQEKHRNPDDGTYSLRLEGDAYDEYNNGLVQQYRLLVAHSKSTSHIPSSHSPSILPTSSAARPSAAASSALIGDHLQAEMTQGFRPVPSPINTGRGVPSNQNIHSPSPTYSPINSLHPPLIPNSTAAFTPQFATAVPHVLPNSPSAGTPSPYQSPYQSPNIPQQGQYGASGVQTQQGAQQRQYELHLRQQQFQLQQQQFLAQQYRIQQQKFMEWQQAQQQQYQPQPQQYQQQPQQYQQQSQQYQQQIPQIQQLHRKRSQPGAVPSPRPSPVQTARSLPGQVLPTGQPSPRFQSTSSHSVLAAPNRNLVPSSGSPSFALPLGVMDPMLSPRTMSAVQSSNVQSHLLAGLQRQPAQTIDRLIPSPGSRINLQDYPHTPYEKRSVDNALHQAHLRSPKRIHRGPLTADSSERHYQAIKGFALEPTPIPSQAYLYEFMFDVAGTVLGKLSLNERVAGETLPINRFSDGSLRIRLRCCNRPVTTEPIPDHIWVTSETIWPDHIFISLNDRVVEVKRKQHHSKDLPVEISSFVRLGMNSLSISVPAQSPQRKPHTPYVAIEIVEVLSHSSILRMVNTSGTRPANETRELIQRRLAGSLTNEVGDDNDLEIPNDGISIDLADPFTSTIFTVPVRGNACTHLECFDLENWLNTRLGKKAPCVCGGPNCKCPKEPSFVDRWRCPLCDGDARPYSLRIDEFLVEVRTSLEQNDQLRTKSITVVANGSWRANYSPEDDDSDLDSDDHGTRATSKATSKPSVPRTVIELDDD